jgi:hypothetical protein
VHVLRDMLELKSERKPIPIEDVEPASGGCWLWWWVLFRALGYGRWGAAACSPLRKLLDGSGGC